MFQVVISSYINNNAEELSLSCVPGINNDAEELSLPCVPGVDKQLYYHTFGTIRRFFL